MNIDFYRTNELYEWLNLRQFVKNKLYNTKDGIHDILMMMMTAQLLVGIIQVHYYS
jgi:hypothetical protein